MIASNVTGFGGSSVPFEIPQTPEVIEVKETLPNQNKKITVTKTMTVEQYVRNYFSDIPIMIEIAKCESTFRQHDKEGKVLRGVVNSADRGVMQVNLYYHEDPAEKLGYDVHTLEGNTSYARVLFEKSGVQPWKSSKPCWSKTTAYADYVSGNQLAVK